MSEQVTNGVCGGATGDPAGGGASAGASAEAHTSSPPAVDPEPSISVVKIVPDALDVMWPKVQKLIRESVKSSPITSRLETINDVRNRTYMGDYQLWCIFKNGEVIAAALTMVTTKTRARILDVVYGAGEGLFEWIEEFYQTLDDEAVELDCRFLRLEGRADWSSTLKKLGFEQAYAAFMKEV